MKSKNKERLEAVSDVIQVILLGVATLTILVAAFFLLAFTLFLLGVVGG